jgi:ankyrin repeat protein
MQRTALRAAADAERSVLPQHWDVIMNKQVYSVICASLTVVLGCTSMLGGQSDYAPQAARETALVDAGSRGDLTATRQLPEAGADPSAKGLSVWPPLLTAIFTNHGELVPALIAAGADIEVADDDGMTPLMWAAYLSRDDVVAELLAAGARVDIRDKYGRTPLHLASERSDLIVVRALLDAGSDVNAQDGSGRTAMMIAAVVTEISNLKALIREGASPSGVDNRGRTALDYAVERGTTKKARLAVRLLRRAGA